MSEVGCIQEGLWVLGVSAGVVMLSIQKHNQSVLASRKKRIDYSWLVLS